MSVRPGYIVGPVTDVAFLGGLSVVVWAWFRFAPEASASFDAAGLAATLVWVVNYPHFAATSYRLYSSKRSMMQFPVTAFAIPAVLVAAAAAAFAAPDEFAPWLVKLFILWSPYHYAGQTLGLTLMYSRRCGWPITGGARRLLNALVLTTFVAATARFEQFTSEQQFFGVRYVTLGIPEWVYDASVIALWLLSTAFLGWLAIGAARTRRIPPVAMLMPLAAQFLWLVIPTPGAFMFLVPAFHSLQYLYVGWIAQLASDGGIRSAPCAARSSAWWFAVSCAGGIALFWLFPRIGTIGGASLAVSTAIVLSVVQIHHFFVDGVIWKLSSPTTSSPLVATWFDVTAPVT